MAGRHFHGMERGPDLCSLLHAALDGVQKAAQLLCCATPNARDYYVTPGATELVLEQHRARLQKLNEVAAELEEMRDHVYAVIAFKEAR